MRTALITFLASALGVVVVLSGYEFFWKQREARLEREAEIQAQRDAVARGDAMAARLMAEERAIAAMHGDIVVASSARVAVAEAYFNTARMPVTNAGAGLPEPAEYRGRSLRSLSVGADGRLVLVFDAQSGHEGGTIEFIPELGGPEAMGMQWRCETRDYSWIRRVLPTCEYLGAGAANASDAPATSPP